MRLSTKFHKIRAMFFKEFGQAVLKRQQPHLMRDTVSSFRGFTHQIQKLFAVYLWSRFDAR